MKTRGLAGITLLALLCTLTTAAPAVEKGELWKGRDWQAFTHELKTAYVKGIGNMADFETAAAGSAPPPCISKGFVDELKTKSLGQLISEVDKYYRENPGKMDMPVIAVILQHCTKLCASPPTAEKK